MIFRILLLFIARMYKIPEFLYEMKSPALKTAIHHEHRMRLPLIPLHNEVTD